MHRRNSDGESRSILRTFPTVFVESFFPEMEERILFLSIPFDLLPAVGLTDTQTGLSGGTLQQENFIICTTPVKLSPVRHQCRGVLMP